ncbi:hypothetical protein HDV00_010540 [Rhizophlyctis rosea]|nr:hypothetical protein HDV00_010540 [Rhizophlyctis rosea]
MAGDKLTFYTNAGCPYAQRAAITLKELNLPHDHVEIDLENKPEWYHKINPETKVPALAVNDTVITESLVITEYLLEAYPNNILASTPLARAQQRFFVQLVTDKINAKTGAIQWGPLQGNFDDAKKEKLTAELLAGIRQVNSYLNANSGTGPFAFGASPSYADVALGPFLLRLPVFTHISGVSIPTGVDYDRFHQWIKAVEGWKSAQETYPGSDVIIPRIERRIAKAKAAAGQA